MHIQIFNGSDSDMDAAIAEATKAVQSLLDNLSAREIASIQTQTFVDRWDEDGRGYHTCFCVVTVAYE
jgi:hypothetical protein